ncbi:MAG: hypothetical protein II916_08180 [Oscillospiraceae bacterium]|nr:hypothetical protein [Oscillospiraceae bacterium]
MSLFDKFRARYQRRTITGKVVDIDASRTDTLPLVVINYENALGQPQILMLRVKDTAPYEPVGKKIPLRFRREVENGREVFIPELLSEEDKV